MNIKEMLGFCTTKGCGKKSKYKAAVKTADGKKLGKTVHLCEKCLYKVVATEFVCA